MRELRYDAEADGGGLDDVVIGDVSMFRLERMDKNEWWACCYLSEDGDQRVTFSIRGTRKDGIVITVTEGNEFCDEDRT